MNWPQFEVGGPAGLGGTWAHSAECYTFSFQLRAPAPLSLLTLSLSFSLVYLPLTYSVLKPSSVTVSSGSNTHVLMQ